MITFTLLAISTVVSTHPSIACMPVVDSEELQVIFADPWTYWYDESVLPRAMQMGANAEPVSIHDGYHRFNNIDRTTNANKEFPWLVGGGMHEVKKGEMPIVKFYWHPEHKPIRYYSSRRSSIYYQQNAVDWQFPIDSVVGEVVGMKGKSGTVRVIEIRTLTREIEAWQPRIFRQFNSPEDVAERLLLLGYDALAEQVQTLPVVSKVLTDRTHAKPAVTLKFAEAVLPTFPNEVVRVLLEAPLVDVVAASTLASKVTQILPANYHPGMVGAANREDCGQCHKHVAKHVNNFDRIGRDWYGYVRGSGVAKETGGIFSFHPFSRNSIADNGGRLPISVSRELQSAGYIAPYKGEGGYEVR